MMGAVNTGSGVGRACYESFPFTDDFDAVVGGKVSYEYLDALECVLSPTVDVASEAVASGKPARATFITLVFCVAALARIRVVQAYREEVHAVSEYGELAVLSAIRAEWDNMVNREEMVFVPFSDCVDDIIGPSVSELWERPCRDSMYTCAELRGAFGPIVDDLKVLSVGGLLIVGDKGNQLSAVEGAEACNCVLTLADYRLLMQTVRKISVEHVGKMEPANVAAALSEEHQLRPIFRDKLTDWVWLVMSGAPDFDGYCYQLLVAPRDRWFLCNLLLYEPCVVDLVWALHKLDMSWCSTEATVEVGDKLHVARAGCPDVDMLYKHSAMVIGASHVVPQRQQSVVEVDYFARALVDDFVRKHRRVQTVPDAALPVDPNFEALTIDTATSGNRVFADVGAMLYKGVGEMLSPRAEVAGRARGGLAATGEHVSERDSERVRGLYARLSDGAVIEEDYFRRTRRRISMSRRRPRLDETSGHVYHVFSGFPADGGGGLGPWELDEAWDIPGWVSYVAVFPRDASMTVAFISTEEANDIRMDCTGEGAMEFGACMAAVHGTVLWFTRSVKFKLMTRSEVVLRVSVPMAGSAMAIGADMRRYMYIPGYSIVARSFDVVTGTAAVAVPMERRRAGAVAGCHVYAGNKYVERGRHRFKLSQLASAAPVRMVVKTDPVEALEYVGACGMRVKPRTRDYVSVLVDVANVDLYVSLATEAHLCVSTVQVVRAHEFDLAVASMNRN